MRTRAAIALLTSAALLAAGCGGSDDDANTTTTRDATTTATTATTQAEKEGGVTVSGGDTGAATVEADAPQERFTADFRNGAVTGGPKRWRVDQGEKVTIVVRSDADDEIHVHGYDVKADVTAGESATVSFTADITGAYEVEMEGAHAPLGTLEVR